VAEKGFESKFIDEILHMVEYDSKRPRDDFAINLINQSFGFITHSDYPFVLLHVNEFCEKLRNELKTESVFQTLVKKYLLENNHRLKLILKPKHNLIQELNKEESEKLIKREKELTLQEIEKINNDTQNLIDYQNKLQDINVLPTLTLEDIPRFVEKITTEKEKLAFGKIIF
jgi:presequence protease